MLQTFLGIAIFCVVLILKGSPLLFGTLSPDKRQGAALQGKVENDPNSKVAGALFIEEGKTLTILGSLTYTANRPFRTDEDLEMNIYLMSGGRLDLLLDTDLVLTKPIEGNQGIISGTTRISNTRSGGLFISGTAQITIQGDNTFTGITTIDKGHLRIEGSTVSDIYVAEGGILSGPFSLKPNLQLTNSADLTNGGRIIFGTGKRESISIAGNYTQLSTGTLALDITPSGRNEDKKFLESAGATFNGGTIEVHLNPGNYLAGTPYQVVTAPGSGWIDHLSVTGPFAKFVQLEFDPSTGILVPINHVLFKHQKIVGEIPHQIVEAIHRFAPLPSHADFASAVELLGTLPSSQVNRALSSLSPVLFGAAEWVNGRNNSYITSILSDHLFDLFCSPRECSDCNSAYWIAPFGNLMENTKWLDNLPPFSANGWGILSGIDYHFNPGIYLGGAFSYTHTGINWRDDWGKGSTNSYGAALYGSFEGCLFAIDWSLLGGGTKEKMDRTISFATIHRNSSSNFWSWFVTPHLGARGMISSCNWTFEPFALLDYHYWHREGFREKGSAQLDLELLAKTQHMLQAEGGLELVYTLSCPTYCLAPYLGASWVGEFPLHPSRQRATFISQTTPIDVTSYYRAVNLASAIGGFKWGHCSGASFLLGYKGLFNTKTVINQIEARFDWVF